MTHNPDGKIACGAVGLIKESTEARKVTKLLIAMLKDFGHTVYDCTEDKGISQGDVLEKIVKRCNENNVDLDISIHFNAGADDLKGNGKSTGTEAYVYDRQGVGFEYAKGICEEISRLGYKNRGVKESRDFYFLRMTKAPAILIECCFVDDKDDVELYYPQKMADAIAKGIHKLGGGESEVTTEEAIKIIKEKCGFDDNTILYLQMYRYGDSFITRLGEKLKKI